jgi:hypothetical protein
MWRVGWRKKKTKDLFFWYYCAYEVLDDEILDATSQMLLLAQQEGLIDPQKRLKRSVSLVRDNPYVPEGEYMVKWYLK